MQRNVKGFEAIKEIFTKCPDGRYERNTTSVYVNEIDEKKATKIAKTIIGREPDIMECHPRTYFMGDDVFFNSYDYYINTDENGKPNELDEEGSPIKHYRA